MWCLYLFGNYRALNTMFREQEKTRNLKCSENYGWKCVFFPCFWYSDCCFSRKWLYSENILYNSHFIRNMLFQQNLLTCFKYCDIHSVCNIGRVRALTEGRGYDGFTLRLLAHSMNTWQGCSEVCLKFTPGLCWCHLAETMSNMTLQ